MFNLFPLPGREDLRIFWGLQFLYKGEGDAQHPTASDSRDFCKRNIKRAERVAKNLVGAWEGEEQIGQLLLDMGQRCFTEVSAGGNSPAAVYCHF